MTDTGLLEGRTFLSPERSLALARIINVAALFGLLAVLAGSLHLQFGVGEQPCPLCIVQRSGMIGLAVGPMMNLLWGMRPRHYALSILAAVVGAAGSTRQILLHIADPNDPGYGPTVFGWHLYTWALVTFIIGVVGCTVLIMWQTPFSLNDRGVLHDLRQRSSGANRTGGFIGVVAVAWISIVAIVWVVIDLLAVGFSILPECGLGECPDDPEDIAGLGNLGGWVVMLIAGVIAAVIAVVIIRRAERTGSADR